VGIVAREEIYDLIYIIFLFFLSEMELYVLLGIMESTFLPVLFRQGSLVEALGC
jgi:hypothetical protein